MLLAHLSWHLFQVFVSRIDEGSICEKALIAGDRIIDVNGEPVSDKDVARTMLVKSLAVGSRLQ